VCRSYSDFNFGVTFFGTLYITLQWRLLLGTQSTDAAHDMTEIVISGR